MRVHLSTRAICILAVATITSATSVQATGALDDGSRLLAVRAAFGLGCAVQDRDEVRANAWAQTMMSHATLLATASPQQAKEFAAFVSGTAVEVMRRGEYECDAIPKLP